MYEGSYEESPKAKPFTALEAGAAGLGFWLGVGWSFEAIHEMGKPANAANKQLDSLHAGIDNLVTLDSHLSQTPTPAKADIRQYLNGEVMRQEHTVQAIEVHKPQAPDAVDYAEVFGGLPLLGAFALTALVSIARRGFYSHRQKVAAQEAEQAYMEEQIQDFRESIDARDRRR
jgi:uncharacterized protein HemX